MGSAWNCVSQLTKVVVTVNDKITLRLLTADLGQERGFEVDFCEASHAITDRISASLPAIVLLGARAQDSASETLGLLRKLRDDFPKIRAIVLSDACGREFIAEIFRAGARGFFNRQNYDREPLCTCIRRVAEGQIWASSEELSFVLDAFSETTPLPLTAANGIEQLTPREREVVRLVVEGFSNREAAVQLGLSTHTVKNYIFSVFDKVGVSSRAELIMFVLSKVNRYQSLESSRSHSLKAVAIKPERIKGERAVRQDSPL